VIQENQNEDQHAMGMKLDKDKPDVSLLFDFGRALMAVSEVGTFGAKKYARGSWVMVPDGISRYTAAMGRHLLAEGMGEAHDAESGLRHAAHAAWDSLARLDLMLREEETWKKGQ